MTNIEFVPLPEWAAALGRPVRIAALKRRSKDDPDTKSLQVQDDAIFGWLDSAMPPGSWTCDRRPAEAGGDVFSQVVSGWAGDGNHTLLRQLMSRLADYDVVVVYRLDRVGRNALTVFTAVKEMGDAGVRLYSVEEGIDTANPAQNFTSGLFVLLAQQASDLTSARIKGNKARAKAKGGWRGGAITYGYRKAMTVDADGAPLPVRDANAYKTLEIDPLQAKELTDTVDLIVDHGWSLAAAVRRLNQLGVPTARGMRVNADGVKERIDWEVTSLKLILASPALTGHDVVGVGKDRHRVLLVNGAPHRPNPPILTDERWHQLQQAMGSRTGKRRGRVEALLAGLVVCEGTRVDGTRCARPLYGPGTITANNASYACRGSNNLDRADPRRCTGNAVSAAHLQRLVELVVAGIAADPRWQAALAGAYTQARSDAVTEGSDVAAELTELTRQMADLRAEKTKAQSDRRREQAEREIDTLDAKIAKLEALRVVPTTVAVPVVNFTAAWETMTPRQRRAVIGDLVETIHVTPALVQTGKAGRTFDPARVRIVLRHVGVVHITEPVQVAVPVPCPDCGSVFGGKLALGAHRRHKHGVVGATSTRPLRPVTAYTCPQPGCGKITTSAGGIARHVRAAHGIHQALTCPVGCPKTFAGTLELASHCRQAHQQSTDTAPTVCQECGKVLRGERGLSIHSGRVHPTAA